MKTQNTTHNIKRTVYSGSLALTLASIIAAAMLALPTVAWSQTAEWTVYNAANSGLPYNGVAGLAIDAQGNIWVGTGRWYAFAGGGLAKFDGQNWTVYNTANSGLPNNDHTGLAVDDQGNVWIGTEGGTLTKFDGESWTVYGPPTSSGQLASPSFDAQGNLWIGSYGGGLVKFDGVDDWTVYTTGNSGLPHNRAWATAIDAQGNVWIGTAGGGVAKFDGVDNWTVYNTSNSGLPHNNAAGSLAIDGQGNVWIGTWGGGGLARFDGEVWTVYNTSNSGLPDNRIYSLAIDTQGGNIWIGTESGGLAVFHPVPAVDFNGDGVVDINDLLRLIESWGQYDPAVDIGPTALGDGVIDAADLEVLMSYWQQEVEDPTLVVHWKLDETEGNVAYDSAGVNDGILNGEPLWQPTGGMIDGALAFDGIDDYVNTPFVLNPAGGKFSVFAWIKGGAPGQVVISQTDGVNWLSTDQSGGNLMTMLKGSGRSAGPLQSQTVITDDNWHRIGLVWDGSQRMLYVDDVAVAEDTQDSLGSSEGGLYIGTGKAMEPGSFWSGLIDDVRIYNRVVRP